jgi:hypothetical protein
MKRLSLIVLLSMSEAIHACSAAATEPDVAKYLSQQGWTAFENRAKFANPSPDIAPVMYYGKGTNVPSCGLLSAATGTPRFIEILAAETGEQYPHCAGINDAAAFKLAGKEYLVFGYLDRDTRDETYEQFFYVFKDKTGDYSTDEQLNQGAGNAANEVPAKKAGTNAALKGIDGIRLARTYMMKKSQPTLELQSRDLITDNKGAFAVFLDKSSATCSFVLDNGIELSAYSSELFAEHRACQNYLASSKFDAPDKTYYLGMFKGGDASTKIAIFSIAKNTSAVRAEKELALSAAATRKVADIKSLKAYLAEVERKKDK